MAAESGLFMPAPTKGAKLVTKAGTPAGYIIAFSFSKGIIEEAARLRLKENIVIKLVPVEEIVPIAVKPKIAVVAEEISKKESGEREILFTATGHSLAGIEFYSWDFAYDEKKKFRPQILLDKEGRQTQTLKAGLHAIACKVVDNDGLENMEIAYLKINGGLTNC
jgi:hypothetical protein